MDRHILMMFCFIFCLPLLACGGSSPLEADSGLLDTGIHDGLVVDLAADHSRSDSDSTDVFFPKDAGPATLYCPGGKPFFDGELSGVFSGTATVPDGASGSSSQHDATLALASICGSLRGVLQLSVPGGGLFDEVSFKIKGEVTGNVAKIVLSDRYCGGMDCSPHLTAGAGMEIFEGDLQLTGTTVTLTNLAIRPKVSYAGLELPLTELTAARTFPTVAHETQAEVAGRWSASLTVVNEVFASEPIDGDNELIIDSQAVKSWKTSFADNVLEDTAMFPSALLDTQVRRIGITQLFAVDWGYTYLAVFDGNWLIGVARETQAGSISPTSDVPTAFSKDNALVGIWIGYRSGAD
jgi:hypothetical protein